MTSEPRHNFHRELAELEQQTLGGLDLVVSQLERAIEALNYQNVELAEFVVIDDDRIDGRYLEVHQGVLSLLARQAPVATDLRLVAALLHVIRCVERMGDQCVNIAKVVPLSGYDSPTDKKILDLIEDMALRTRDEVIAAKDAFALRDVDLAVNLVTQDAEINRLNRDIFKRAVEIGDEHELREWAMFMTLAGRALERLGDNAVDIAEQAAFVVTGLFREFSGGSVASDSRPIDNPGESHPS